MNDQVKDIIRFIVYALSIENTQVLVDRNLLASNEVTGIIEVLQQYGRHLIPIPQTGWNLADIYAIENQENNFDIDIPLWTMEEGRSDLMLKINVNHGAVKILDILVP